MKVKVADESLSPQQITAMTNGLRYIRAVSAAAPTVQTNLEFSAWIEDPGSSCATLVSHSSMTCTFYNNATCAPSDNSFVCAVQVKQVFVSVPSNYKKKKEKRSKKRKRKKRLQHSNYSGPNYCGSNHPRLNYFGSNSPTTPVPTTAAPTTPIATTPAPTLQLLRCQLLRSTTPTTTTPAPTLQPLRCQLLRLQPLIINYSLSIFIYL